MPPLGAVDTALLPAEQRSAACLPAAWVTTCRSRLPAAVLRLYTCHSWILLPLYLPALYTVLLRLYYGLSLGFWFTCLRSAGLPAYTACTYRFSFHIVYMGCRFLPGFRFSVYLPACLIPAVLWTLPLPACCWVEGGDYLHHQEGCWVTTMPGIHLFCSTLTPFLGGPPACLGCLPPFWCILQISGHHWETRFSCLGATVLCRFLRFLGL